MIALAVIPIYVIIEWLELPPLIGKKDIKGIIANLSLTALSFAVAVLLAAGCHLPSPSDMIINVIASIFGK